MYTLWYFPTEVVQSNFLVDNTTPKSSFESTPALLAMEARRFRRRTTRKDKEEAKNARCAWWNRKKTEASRERIISKKFAPVTQALPVPVPG